MVNILTYNKLLERNEQLRKEKKELKKELANYKFLYEQEKEEKNNLRKKIKEKNIILDMFYKRYYK